MIQRPQTIALILVALLMLAAAFFPAWQKENDARTLCARQTAWTTGLARDSSMKEIIREESRHYIGGLMVLAAGLAIYTLLQYRNRILQLKLGFGLTLLMAGILVSLMLSIRQAEAWMDSTREGVYKPGFYLVFAALFCNFVSNRLIRKDEKLVRSMDRIR